MFSHIYHIVEPIMHLSIMVMIGIYFIFSNTVMKALRSHPSGAEIMVEINEMILNPLFLLFFMGSAISAVYLMFSAQEIVIIGAIVFFIGTTAVTVIKNVPLNNQLRDVTDEQRPEVWKKYLTEWLFWNHIRTISAMISGILLIL